jgi:hypothetical protein
MVNHVFNGDGVGVGKPQRGQHPEVRPEGKTPGKTAGGSGKTDQAKVGILAPAAKGMVAVVAVAAAMACGTANSAGWAETSPSDPHKPQAASLLP